LAPIGATLAIFFRKFFLLEFLCDGFILLLARLESPRSLLAWNFLLMPMITVSGAYTVLGLKELVDSNRGSYYGSPNTDEDVFHRSLEDAGLLAVLNLKHALFALLGGSFLTWSLNMIYPLMRVKVKEAELLGSGAKNPPAVGTSRRRQASRFQRFLSSPTLYCILTGLMSVLLTFKVCQWQERLANLSASREPLPFGSSPPFIGPLPRKFNQAASWTQGYFANQLVRDLTRKTKIARSGKVQSGNYSWNAEVRSSRASYNKLPEFFSHQVPRGTLVSSSEELPSKISEIIQSAQKTTTMPDTLSAMLEDLEFGQFDSEKLTRLPSRAPRNNFSSSSSSSPSSFAKNTAAVSTNTASAQQFQYSSTPQIVGASKGRKVEDLGKTSNLQVRTALRTSSGSRNEMNTGSVEQYTRGSTPIDQLGFQSGNLPSKSNRKHFGPATLEEMLAGTENASMKGQPEVLYTRGGFPYVGVPPSVSSFTGSSSKSGPQLETSFDKIVKSSEKYFFNRLESLPSTVSDNSVNPKESGVANLKLRQGTAEEVPAKEMENPMASDYDMDGISIEKQAGFMREMTNIAVPSRGSSGKAKAFAAAVRASPSADKAPITIGTRNVNDRRRFGPASISVDGQFQLPAFSEGYAPVKVVTRGTLPVSEHLESEHNLDISKKSSGQQRPAWTNFRNRFPRAEYNNAVNQLKNLRANSPDSLDQVLKGSSNSKNFENVFGRLGNLDYHQLKNGRAVEIYQDVPRNFDVPNRKVYSDFPPLSMPIHFPATSLGPLDLPDLVIPEMPFRNLRARSHLKNTEILGVKEYKFASSSQDSQKQIQSAPANYYQFALQNSTIFEPEYHFNNPSGNFPSRNFKNVAALKNVGQKSEPSFGTKSDSSFDIDFSQHRLSVYQPQKLHFRVGDTLGHSFWLSERLKTSEDPYTSPDSETKPTLRAALVSYGPPKRGNIAEYQNLPSHRIATAGTVPDYTPQSFTPLSSPKVLDLSSQRAPKHRGASSFPRYLDSEVSDRTPTKRRNNAPAVFYGPDLPYGPHLPAERRFLDPWVPIVGYRRCQDCKKN
jgi:hypothetical protein